MHTESKERIADIILKSYWRRKIRHFFTKSEYTSLHKYTRGMKNTNNIEAHKEAVRVCWNGSATILSRAPPYLVLDLNLLELKGLHFAIAARSSPLTTKQNTTKNNYWHNNAIQSTREAKLPHNFQTLRWRLRRIDKCSTKKTFSRLSKSRCVMQIWQTRRRMKSTEVFTGVEIFITAAKVHRRIRSRNRVSSQKRSEQVQLLRQPNDTISLNLDKI